MEIDCFTELDTYIGEHLSQGFFSRLSIRNIRHGTTIEPNPVIIDIGQPTPIDLSDGYASGEVSHNAIVLCVPLHLFQRTVALPCITMTSPSHLAATEQLPIVQSGGRRRTRRRSGGSRIISLATISIYFPVEYMQSADDTTLASHLRKRIHHTPHEHEFVAYPNPLTLPIDKLGGRIVSGLLKVDRLLKVSLPLPVTIEQGLNCFQKSLCTLSNQLDVDSLPLSMNDSTEKKDLLGCFNRFIVASEAVYNRVRTIMQREKEAVQETQNQQISYSTGHPWARLRTWPSNTTPSDTPVIETGDGNALLPKLDSVVCRIGLRLRKTTIESINRAVPDPPVDWICRSARESIRIVFVRRSTHDCGFAISQDLLRFKHLPPRLRRTKLRGTTHHAIKFKRHFSDISAEGNEFEHSRQATDVGEQVPLKRVRAQNDNFDTLCILTSPRSHRLSSSFGNTIVQRDNMDDGWPQSPTQPFQSSIVTRVKGKVIPSPNIDSAHVSSEPPHNFDSQSDKSQKPIETVPIQRLHVIGRRSRVPPKRFDLLDQDLEVALQRNNKSRKRTTTSWNRKSVKKTGPRAQNRQARRNRIKSNGWQKVAADVKTDKQIVPKLTFIKKRDGNFAVSEALNARDEKIDNDVMKEDEIKDNLNRSPEQENSICLDKLEDCVLKPEDLQKEAYGIQPDPSGKSSDTITNLNDMPLNLTANPVEVFLRSPLTEVPNPSHAHAPDQLSTEGHTSQLVSTRESLSTPQSLPVLHAEPTTMWTRLKVPLPPPDLALSSSVSIASNQMCLPISPFTFESTAAQLDTQSPYNNMHSTLPSLSNPVFGINEIYIPTAQSTPFFNQPFVTPIQNHLNPNFDQINPIANEIYQNMHFVSGHPVNPTSSHTANQSQSTHPYWDQYTIPSASSSSAISSNNSIYTQRQLTARSLPHHCSFVTPSTNTAPLPMIPVDIINPDASDAINFASLQQTVSTSLVPPQLLHTSNLLPSVIPNGPRIVSPSLLPNDSTAHPVSLLTVPIPNHPILLCSINDLCFPQSVPPSSIQQRNEPTPMPLLAVTVAAPNLQSHSESINFTISPLTGVPPNPCPLPFRT